MTSAQVGVSELTEAQKKEAEEMELYIDFDKYGIDRDKFMKGMFLSLIHI